MQSSVDQRFLLVVDVGVVRNTGPSGVERSDRDAAAESCDRRLPTSQSAFELQSVPAPPNTVSSIVSGHAPPPPTVVVVVVVPPSVVVVVVPPSTVVVVVPPSVVVVVPPHSHEASQVSAPTHAA